MTINFDNGIENNKDKHDDNNHNNNNNNNVYFKPVNQVKC